MIVFLAIPTGDGRMTVRTAMSLVSEGEAFAEANIGVELCYSTVGGLHFARDQLAYAFLASKADRLIFIDEDVSWEPGELVRLAKHSVDVVGGAYRYKQDEVGYPVLWAGEPEAPAQGLVEVKGLQGGFLSISRAVFEKMRAAHPERAYKHCGNDVHGFFCMPYGGGEDFRFCADWRNLGGKVWLDPDLNLTHHSGDNAYPGNIGEWLRSRLKVAA